MRRRFKLIRSLRGRLVLLACLSTFPAFLFVLFVATQERGAELRRAESETRYVASLASREHAHQVAGAERLLERLGSQGAPEHGREALDQMLPALLSGFPQFANLGILAPDGSLAYSVVPASSPVSMKDNPAFQGALRSESVVVGRYQMGQIVHRQILIMARALRKRDGTLTGVLFGALDLQWLDELALQAKLPPDYVLFIVDRGGRVLARSQSSANPIAVEGEQLPSFNRMVQNSHGLTRETGRDGISRLFTASPLEGSPDLYVAVGLPEARVISMANRAFIRAMIALAALTLLTVASSIAAADLSILRDLRLLARATRHFGDGDLKARAPVPLPGGEIQDLALAFNSMASALERRDREATQVQEGLRALSHRVEAAREEEGARISRELHDQLGQELTSLKLELAHLKRKLKGAPSSTGPEEIETALDTIGFQIDACVDSVRHISAQLRPSILDRLGLCAALEWLTRETERRTGIPGTFEGSETSSPIHPTVTTALFRITQEALTNVARHAQAGHVRVGLKEEGGHLAVCIEDDGKGFDPAALGDSLGLLGMRERARLAGGTLEIASGPSGTTVSARVPRTPPVTPEKT